MDHPSISVTAAVPALPSEYCDAFRRTAGKLIREGGADESVVAACAVHTGIQFMLRAFAAEEVAAWLDEKAREIREFAGTDGGRARPSRRGASH